MKQITIKYFIFLIVIALVFASSSCQTYSNLLYIKQNSNADTTYYTTHYIEYRLKPTDVLNVNIISNDKVVKDVFNNELFNQNSGGSTGGTNLYLSGYKVDENGLIEIPLIGSLQVGGMTINEAEKYIVEKIKQKFPSATVKMQLVSYKVTFMGEVGSAGTVYMNSDKVNIIEAIISVGGVSPTGNKKNIRILRKTTTGYKEFEVDLTKVELIESTEFFLYPDDIVYVEPLRSKPIRLVLNDYFTILGTITSTVAIILTFINLTKNP